MAGANGWRSRDFFLTYLPMAVILCAGLLSCRHAAGPNTVVVYLQSADQQWETQEQGREIEKALSDMLTLSPDELRNRRYANYQMQPGAWVVIELLHRYFVSRGLVYIDETTFYQDVTDPAAQAVIRQHLKKVKESIPLHPTFDTDEKDEETE